VDERIGLQPNSLKKPKEFVRLGSKGDRLGGEGKGGSKIYWEKRGTKQVEFKTFNELDRFPDLKKSNPTVSE